MVRRVGSPPPPATAVLDAPTEPSPDSSERAEALLAVYVTTPARSTRHLLSPGLVRLGRGPDSTLVVDDPRVSRSHALLHVGREILLSDVGSANGTFLGGQRLGPGEARRVSLGETFFLAEAALVLRRAPLRRTRARITSDRAEVQSCLDALLAPRRSAPSGGGLVVLSIRPSRAAQARVLPPLVAELIDAPSSFVFAVGTHHLIAAGPARSPEDAVRYERLMAEQLARWEVFAEVEVRFARAEDVRREGPPVDRLFEVASPILRQRGPVVLVDPAMIELERTVSRVASAPVTVLVLGETGAGKDVVASMIHGMSPRANGPLVRINCASLPEALLESELFGHERGAFTGAVGTKEGLLEAARGGTVFLDEIGELPLGVQAKLLHALESNEITRVGSLRPRSVDVRFVAATNRDLGREVAAGRFRADLYYRLNTVTLHVPPLRDRPSEIEPLARAFTDHAAARFGQPSVRLSASALEALRSYSWPGNVRELRNVIERAVLLAPQSVIEPEHLSLPPTLTEAAAADWGGGPEHRDPRTTAAPAAEPTMGRERIAQALQECGGNQSRAAKLLGISRRTLVRYIAQLGLPRPRGS